MTAWLPYGTPENVCKSVQKVPAAFDRLGKLVARPWNRHESTTTMWWLLPADGTVPVPQVAYSRGKLVFSGDEQQMHVGIYVEKGLSPEAMAATGSAKALVMTNQWQWHRFVRALQVGAVSAALDAVVREYRLPLELWVSGHVPGASANEPADEVVFQFSEGRLSSEKPAKVMKVLPPIWKAQTTTDLAKELADPKLEWAWIDFQIVASFDLAPNGEQAEADRWDGARLWSHLLSKLAPWVG